MPARAKRAKAPDFTVAAEAPAPREPDFGAYTIDDLKHFRCRFICSADGKPHRYCGRPIAPRRSGKYSSWCADHLEVVFIAGSTVPGFLRKKGSR